MSQFYAPIQEISAGAILLLPLQSEKLLIGDKNESAENQLQTSEGNVMGDESFDRRKLIFPGLAGLYETFSPYSYSLMRFAAGALLVPHGIQKIMNGSWTTLAPYIEKQLGVPYPLGWAYLAIFAESVVAACLAIGLFTRLAALILIVYMGIIILFFQWQFGYFWTNRGIEYALLWWILYVAIFFRGGGRYSVDYYLNKQF